jgi:hypothetical protein
MCVTGATVLWFTAAGVAQAEWIVSGYLGAAATQAAPLRVIQPSTDTDVTLESVRYRGGPFTPPLYYGLRMTWFPGAASWLGLDAELIHLKAYARSEQPVRASGRFHGGIIDRSVPVGEAIERFSLSHGLNFLLFNAVARRALGTGQTPGRIVLTGRIGAGPTIPHAESAANGMSTEGYEWGSLGWQAAVGLQVRILRRADLLGEYKFTRTGQSVSIVQGTAKGVFASHHVVAGLAWTF